MLTSISRRRLLGGVAVAVVALQPFGEIVADQVGLTCVFQESGKTAPMQWPLVVAAVFTEAESDFDSRVKTMREKTNYNGTLNLRTPAGYGYAKALLDLFAEDAGLSVSAQIVTDQNNHWPPDFRDRDAYYFSWYRSIVEPALADFSSVSVRIPRSGDKRGQLLLPFLATLDSRPTVTEEPGPLTNLGQLTSALAACIRSEWVGGNDVDRTDLVTYCRQALGVSKLTDVRSDKIQVGTYNIV